MNSLWLKRLDLPSYLVLLPIRVLQLELKVLNTTQSTYYSYLGVQVLRNTQFENLIESTIPSSPGASPVLALVIGLLTDFHLILKRNTHFELIDTLDSLTLPSRLQLTSNLRQDQDTEQLKILPMP
ncbi:hypothetical protein B296_00000004 [Ensete ventricosum]|uniref:Uncharacterized protein n=1 Tax=Ensete ventricosum TaxID=4639 RepID=A0A427ASW0_ENSVE|nr:hypothetical protein B296_00000004 [Ensete ventricosum]